MLGAELRKAREEAKMTQEELSFAAEIDRTYVSQLERELKSPTVDTLFRICDALGIAASDLIARVERTRKPKLKRKGR
jgi:transcriptional regulator with XRE-family HTH domain